MDMLGNGLVTLANGAQSALSGLLSPMGIAMCIIGVSLSWLALVEVELLNRQGAKPRIGRH